MSTDLVKMGVLHLKICALDIYRPHTKLVFNLWHIGFKWLSGTDSKKKFDIIVYPKEMLYLQQIANFDSIIKPSTNQLAQRWLTG